MLLTTTNNPFGGIRKDVLTLDDVVQEFKLDSWHVEKHPNHDKEGSVIQDSFHLKRFNESGAGEYHGQVFNKCVGTKYNVIEYKKGLDFLTPYFDEDYLTLNTAFMEHDGSLLGLTCDPITQTSTEIVPGDTVARYFLFGMNHVNKPRFMGFSDICIVCANTLQAGYLDCGKRGKRFTFESVQSMEEARGAIDWLTQQFFDIESQYYKAYQARKLEWGQVDHIFRQLLNIGLTDNLTDVSKQTQKRYASLVDAYHSSPGQILRGNEHTAYKVLSAVTYVTQNRNDTAGWYNNIKPSSGLRKNCRDLLNTLLPVSAIPV